jgi:hypothetical protein
MKQMIRLRKYLIVGMLLFYFILFLSSCTKISDELVLRKIKSAKELSDLFQAICVGTKADTTQIRRLATSLHWKEMTLSQKEKTDSLTGKWTTTFNQTGIVLITGKAFDPAWGKVMEMCSFAYNGNAEPAFVKNVIAKSGLKRVKPGTKRTTPNNQIITLPDDQVLLSDTGEWGGLWYFLWNLISLGIGLSQQVLSSPAAKKLSPWIVYINFVSPYHSKTCDKRLIRGWKS